MNADNKPQTIVAPANDIERATIKGVVKDGKINEEALNQAVQTMIVEREKRKDDVKKAVIESVKNGKVSLVEQTENSATVKMSIDAKSPITGNTLPTLEIAFKGEIKGNDFVVTEAQTGGNTIKATGENQIIIKDVVNNGKIDLEKMRPELTRAAAVEFNKWLSSLQVDQALNMLADSPVTDKPVAPSPEIAPNTKPSDFKQAEPATNKGPQASADLPQNMRDALAKATDPNYKPEGMNLTVPGKFKDGQITLA
jgi:hypothetical protein